MNRCFTLAFDDAKGVDHLAVSVFGHGALLGKLTLRQDERRCFERLFYVPEDTLVYTARPEENVEITNSQGTRSGRKLIQNSVVLVEPRDVPCPYKKDRS